MMDKTPNIDDGYRVVFADTTKSDWVQKGKQLHETHGQLKKFRTFVFPARYADQKLKTAQQLLSEINKPNARVIYSANTSEPLVYDRYFFEHIEGGEEFLSVRDVIVRENPQLADSFMTKLFRAISQTALKIVYASKLHISDHNKDNIAKFFDTMRYGNESCDVSYRDKLLKKMTELSVKDQEGSIALSELYNRLSRDFPLLDEHIQHICYNTFLYIYHNVPLGPLAVMPKEYMN